jgi:predicted RND superfamily exporter protein
VHGSLERLALFASRHYRGVFITTGLIVALGLGLSLRLRFDTDVLNLLPKTEPALVTYREALEEFGSLDFLLVAVRIPDDAIVDPYEEFAELLGEEMRRIELLGEVEYSLGELEELVAEFFPKALYFLDEEGLQRIALAAREDRLDERAAEIYRTLSMPQGLALKPLMLLDPIGIIDVFFDRLTTSTAGLKLDWTRGSFLSRDHQMLLILAKPVAPPQNVDLARQMVTEIDAAVEQVLAEWDEIAGPGAPLPEVELGGRHIIGIGDESVIRNDFIINLLTSTLGVLLLFLFAFRRFGPLLYAVVPLASGLVLTFGFSYLLYGRLSAATSGVAALLIGLGIDFIIVSYGRFVEERQSGKSLDEALARMSGSCGRAVVVGGTTSAATFYAFGVTDFTGLRQMGFLTGTGILFCMVAVLYLLPALLTWSEHRHTGRGTTPRLFLHGFGSARVIRFCLRHPKPVLVASLLVTGALGYLALGLRFEDSVRSMRPEGSPAVEFREEVAQRFGSGFESMMLLIRGDSLEEVLDTAHAAASRARDLVDQGVLTGVDSVASVFPPLSRQQAVIDWLEQARADGLDPVEVRQRFAAAAQRRGLRLEPFEPGLAMFAEAVSLSRPMSVEDLEASPQSRRLLERYLRQSDGEWQTVVYLYPPPKIWRREPPPQVVELADELGPSATLTGPNVVSSVLRASILEDAAIGAVVGFVLVAILLYIDYRRIVDTLITLAPLVMGIVWMLGTMVMLDLEMNFMNIFVTTMIIGIGVDYGVHSVHRYREIQQRGHGSLEEEVVETGKAIAMAAMSTMVGFGSLSLSHYPGLRSMGLVAILGALATCLVALTVLPAYLTLRSRRHARSA